MAAQLSNAWADNGRKVTILTTDDGQKPSFYHLNPDVSHIALNLRGDSPSLVTAVSNNIRRLLLLRRAIRASSPDLLLSFLDTTNILCLLATRGLPRIPTIVSERTDPHGRPLGRVWEFLRNLVYPWANCIVTQSQHALDYFPERIRRKGRVIPNPVFKLPAASTSGMHRTRFVVVSIGRLQKVKGHDQLIKAFAMIANDLPDWDLCIYGEGPERRSLQELIHVYNLDIRVTLGPHTGDVGSLLKDADLFVLPSRTEGFPNALAEAMAWGLPVISFDCASGPSELIRQGWDGILVPPGDIPALAKAMASLMSNPAERIRLGACAPEVTTRFSPARVLETWESAIQSAIHSAERG